MIDGITAITNNRILPNALTHLSKRVIVGQSGANNQVINLVIGSSSFCFFKDDPILFLNHRLVSFWANVIDQPGGDTVHKCKPIEKLYCI